MAQQKNGHEGVKLRKKLSQDRLIDMLSNQVKPINSDIPYITAMWEWFKSDCRDRYLAKSGGDKDVLLQKLREIECILHSSLRDAFKFRSRQKERHEIDAANFKKLPPSYYDQVASLYNSDTALQSKSMGTHYGEPFDKVYQLKSYEKKLTGNDVKKTIAGWKRAFLKFNEAIGASGSGNDNHRGSEVRNFVNKPLSVDKKIVSYGHHVGYAWIRCREEKVLEDIIVVMPDEFAGTMENTTEIDLNESSDGKNKRKRLGRSTGTSVSSKKNNTSESAAGLGDVKLDLSRKLMKQMARSDTNSRIESIDAQIQSTKQFELSLKQEKRQCNEWIWKCEDRVERRGEDPETDETLIDARADLEECKTKIAEAAVMLQKLEETKKELKVERDSGNETIGEEVDLMPSNEITAVISVHLL